MNFCGLNGSRVKNEKAASMSIHSLSIYLMRFGPAKKTNPGGRGENERRIMGRGYKSQLKNRTDKSHFRTQERMTDWQALIVGGRRGATVGSGSMLGSARAVVERKTAYITSTLIIRENLHYSLLTHSCLIGR